MLNDACVIEHAGENLCYGQICAMVKFVLWSNMCSNGVNKTCFLALCLNDWPVLAFTVDTILLL